jgi:hypothetical protein
MHVSQNTPDPTMTLAFRIERAEREIEQVKTQLNQYVRASENEYRLQNIVGGVERIEQDVKDMKKEVKGFGDQLVSQREGIDKLLIRVLWGGVSLLIGIGGAVLVGFLTHYFH